MTAFTPDLEHARSLDAADELAVFRKRFIIRDPGLIYLDGNSLGRLPVAAAKRARSVVEDEWGETLIGGWNRGWMDLNARVGAKIAALIGAEPDEVIVADSTSVNLFKLAVAALRARPGAVRIVTDDLNFPSDLYILRSALDLAVEGGVLEILRSPDGIHMPYGPFHQKVDFETGAVALSHTAFKSGFVYDMKRYTELAHERRALMLWDLSHSVGAMPLHLRELEVDLAVGCTYKYLNGGPGAPAFLYVRREVQDRLWNPIGGWLGHEDPFAFSPDYHPAAGIRGFVTGSPPIVSMSLIEPGVDLLLEAGMERVRAKSVLATGYLIRLHDAILAPLGFELGSPREPGRRGSHVSLRHPEAYRMTRALVERCRLIPDFRTPDTIRLGVAPLYNSFEEVWRGVDALRRVAETRLYEAYPAERAGVT